MIIEIFTRPQCHLCDEAKKVLAEAAGRFEFELIERNVEESTEWEELYGDQVPVIFIDRRKAFKYFVPPAELERVLTRRRLES